MDGHKVLGNVKPAWVVVAGLGLLALLAAGIPLASLLSVGVLLVCPLLMAGMHGGHAHHDEMTDQLDRSDAAADGSRVAGPPPKGGRR